MCDYSLQEVPSRPAKVGDELVIARFVKSVTRGFCAVEQPSMAVCLLSGTELAFREEVECDHPLGWLLPRLRKLGAAVARFRQINLQRPYAHHDALEFANGKIVLVTRLRLGQQATVLQLPHQTHTPRQMEAQIKMIAQADFAAK
jgi:hypothetical protein